MIKTILWDFDGVIVDSMKIKGDGFKELFKEYDEQLTLQLEKFHYENGGVSRFEKIRYFYNDILKEDIVDERVKYLADNFANIIKKKLYNKDNLIEETVQFIQSYYKEYNFHIVSGAEHQELNNLCEHLGLAQYFISINGSPTPKDILIKNLLDKYGYEKNTTVMIGDSKTDYWAADANGIQFYGYNNPQLKQHGKYIENFEEIVLAS